MKPYVTHTCRNSRQRIRKRQCFNAWIDIDLTNAQTFPPSWKYCEACVNQGFKNPRKPSLINDVKTENEVLYKALYEEKRGA